MFLVFRVYIPTYKRSKTYLLHHIYYGYKIAHLAFICLSNHFVVP